MTASLFQVLSYDLLAGVMLMLARHRNGPQRRLRARAQIFTVIACLGVNSLALAQAPEPRSSPAQPPGADTSDAGLTAPAGAEANDLTDRSAPVAPEPSKPETDTAQPRPFDPATKLMMKALGCEESPIQLYGWIENSFSGNTNGTPRGLSNVTVFPNRLANQWQGNQYYAVLENVLEQSDEINLGSDSIRCSATTGNSPGTSAFLTMRLLPSG